MDVGATVGADGVSIRLPRLRVVVERRQAERLRDALAAVLPQGIDLEHDPRVSDVQVLRAARSLLGERGQDTENLAVAIDHIERDAAAGGAATRRCGPQAAEDRARPYLLSICGDVEPELHEYATEAERLEAARAYRREHPDDGLYRVDVAGTGKVTVDTFTGRELEPPCRCTLCRCDAVGELYGFPVCAYHTDHSEDDAPCPKCYGPLEYWSDANGLHYCDQCMERQPLGATDGLTREAPQPGQDWWCHTCSARLPATAVEEADENARLLVAVGDRVRDPQDGAWRETVRIDDAEGTAYMVDGGCMSVAECAAAEKRLPSESLPCIECGATGRTKGMHS